MKLEQAQKIAESLVDDLSQYCERIEIGGSIRRRKDEVGDIELVCIPKFGEVGTGQGTLFGGEVTEPTNLLFRRISASRYKILKMGGKYCQFKIQLIDSEPINVDVFTATPETWGYIFVLRTGSWDFSRWVVIKLEKRGFTPKDGAVWSEEPGEGLIKIATPTEGDVFDLMQIGYIEPMLRSVEPAESD